MPSILPAYTLPDHSIQVSIDRGGTFAGACFGFVVVVTSSATPPDLISLRQTSTPAGPRRTANAKRLFLSCSRWTPRTTPTHQPKPAAVSSNSLPARRFREASSSRRPNSTTSGALSLRRLFKNPHWSARPRPDLGLASQPLYDRRDQCPPRAQRRTSRLRYDQRLPRPSPHRQPIPSQHICSASPPPRGLVRVGPRGRRASDPPRLHVRPRIREECSQIRRGRQAHQQPRGRDRSRIVGRSGRNSAEAGCVSPLSSRLSPLASLHSPPSSPAIISPLRFSTGLKEHS